MPRQQKQQKYTPLMPTSLPARRSNDQLTRLYQMYLTKEKKNANANVTVVLDSIIEEMVDLLENIDGHSDEEINRKCAKIFQSNHLVLQAKKDHLFEEKVSQKKYFFEQLQPIYNEFLDAHVICASTLSRQSLSNIKKMFFEMKKPQ